MSGLGTWTLTVLTSIVTAGASLAALELSLRPRLTARSQRIADAFSFRSRFSTHTTRIIGACARIRKYALEEGYSPELTERLNAERARWSAQIDDAISYLIDNIEFYA